MSTLWGIVASNAVVATILAIGAMLLGRFWKNAAAVHLLWIVVLLKLFTPPLVTTGLPLASRSLAPTVRADSFEESLNSPANREAVPTTPVASSSDSRGAIATGDRESLREIRFTAVGGREPWSVSTILAAIWIFGACVTAVAYAVRIRRFAGVIRDSGDAPPAILAMVVQLSRRLGLRRVPEILMSTRALPPLVWSIGLRPRVILPSELFDRLSGEAQGTILAHELCHIRRGDHLVRLLDLAATTVFWWHPVVWWASRQLRELEEQCCDGRVLELLPNRPRTYAAALVDTLEFLSARALAPVPLRTAIDSYGSLARRIQMLTQCRSNRVGALGATVVAGLVAFPMAVAFAVEPQQASRAVSKTQQTAGSSPAFLRGRVTDAKGAPLADVRVRVAIPATDMRFADVDVDLKLVAQGNRKLMRARTDYKLLEARSDAEGNYRLEIPGIAERTTISIDAMKPGYRRSVGMLMTIGDPKSVDLAPGETGEASLILKPALYFAGTVVDEQRKPIPGVEISAQAILGNGSGGVERTTSRADGTFELFNYPTKTEGIGKEIGMGHVFFSHPDHIDDEIDDIYAFKPNERGSVRIVLKTGHRVTGTVLDVAGKPVPNAIITVGLRDGSHGKGTTSDANGRFAVRGLSVGVTKLSARALAIKQKVEVPMALNADKDDLVVRLRTIPMPANIPKHAVLGMQLTDVTPELKTAYDLYLDRGAIILDPGKDSDRLDIGDLAEGYCFFMVGNRRIGSVREFVDRLLAETAGNDAAECSVRVVYTFSTADSVGSNTQYMKLTKDDRKQLQIVSDQLQPESE